MDKRARTVSYNRTQFLFDKFIQNRKNRSKDLDVTHEHILVIGEHSMSRLENIKKRHSITSQDFAIRKEIEKLQKEIDVYKKELVETYELQLEDEKETMKKSYDLLMARIEKQRDEAEEERVKELIRKMNEECDEALRKQWSDMEEMKRKQMEEMRHLIRKEMYDETEEYRAKLIKEALEKAEAEFEMRKKDSLDSFEKDKDREWTDKVKAVSERYEATIGGLVKKVNEADEKYKNEKRIRIKLETDFRLLQTDYKRFMNYTDHYNSDYMMKLRHIGAQLIEDKEFEQKLNEKLNNLKLMKSANNLSTKSSHILNSSKRKPTVSSSLNKKPS